MLNTDRFDQTLNMPQQLGLSASKSKDSEYSRTWRAKHPEAKKLSNAAYAKAHPEQTAARKAAWAKANRAKVLASKKAYRLANAEKDAANSAAWRASNPEQARIQVQNKRAKKRENGGQLSSGLALKLFKLQDGKCACCGNPLGDDYHLDHIMPTALGGANEDWNIQLLRQRCNQQKSSKHPVEFMQSRGFLL